MVKGILPVLENSETQGVSCEIFVKHSPAKMMEFYNIHQIKLYNSYQKKEINSLLANEKGCSVLSLPLQSDVISVSPPSRGFPRWMRPKDKPGCVKSLKVKVKSLNRVRLFATPWTGAYQAPPSMGFSRQEYWSGVPLPSPEDLPHPEIEPGSPAS